MPSLNPLDKLTGREREVLALVADGKSSMEVARVLGIKEHTAKGYLKSIFNKLDVANRAQAARIWGQWTPPDADSDEGDSTAEGRAGPTPE